MTIYNYLQAQIKSYFIKANSSSTRRKKITENFKISYAWQFWGRRQKKNTKRPKQLQKYSWGPTSKMYYWLVLLKIKSTLAHNSQLIIRKAKINKQLLKIKMCIKICKTCITKWMCPVLMYSNQQGRKLKMGLWWFMIITQMSRISWSNHKVIYEVFLMKPICTFKMFQLRLLMTINKHRWIIITNTNQFK